MGRGEQGWPSLAKAGDDTTRGTEAGLSRLGCIIIVASLLASSEARDSPRAQGWPATGSYDFHPCTSHTGILSCSPGRRRAGAQAAAATSAFKIAERPACEAGRGRRGRQADRGLPSGHGCDRRTAMLVPARAAVTDHSPSSAACPLTGPGDWALSFKRSRAASRAAFKHGHVSTLRVPCPARTASDRRH